MAARAIGPVVGRPWVNWLERLDKRVSELPCEIEWFDDPELSFQRCRRFIMKRFPELSRPIPEAVISQDISIGEKQIAELRHAKRIQSGLSTEQKGQLAGLCRDIIEGIGFHSRHCKSATEVRKLAAEAERRTRKLSRKTANVSRQLEDLRKYASSLAASLGLDHSRAAERALQAISTLKEGSSAGAYYRSLKDEYPALQDPRQLGIVQLYWFFRHGCRCHGHDAEVRTAMIANELLSSLGRGNLSYIPAYDGAESQGCPAVRLAVSRYRPLTTN